MITKKEKALPKGIFIKIGFTQATEIPFKRETVMIGRGMFIANGTNETIIVRANTFSGTREAQRIAPQTKAIIYGAWEVVDVVAVVGKDECRRAFIRTNHTTAMVNDEITQTTIGEPDAIAYRKAHKKKK